MPLDTAEDVKPGFNEPGSRNVLEISRTQLPNTDYVMIICDVWHDNRDDPATHVSRYAAMFKESDVPEELELGRDRFGFELADRKLLVLWEQLEDLQKPDRESERFKREQMYLSQPERHWGTAKTEATLYEAFMAAIDVLAEDDTNEDAWTAIDAYRNHKAQQHEK